ncbi:MAG: sigma-70 family RNA polymerase sigma factor [Planctomycetes bacterium]|nr:sigma-70 family RNA polymerase sigma factor [Planctomycetota bacterium]
MALPFRRVPSPELSAPPRVDFEALSDAELMQLLVHGEDRALMPLIDRYGGRVRTYLGHVTRDGSWADDLTQEVFVRVFESSGTYDPRFAFQVWVFRIARNLAVDLLRRQSTQRKLRDSLEERAVETERQSIRHRAASSPLQGLVEVEFAEHFERALRRLPEIFRTVFVLREVEGLAYEEIAEVVDASPKTVSTRLHRARLQLRKLLATYLDPFREGSLPSSTSPEGDVSEEQES